MEVQAQDAGLRDWLDAFVRSMSEVAASFGLGEVEVVDAAPLPPALRCAFVSLLGDERSLELGLGSKADGCRRLACALAGLDPAVDSVSEADLNDALGELSNMGAGLAKRSLERHAADLVIGLPTFVEGRFHKARAEELVARVLVGEVEVWLVAQRFPSAPEVRAQRKAERELRAAHEQLRVASEFLKEIFKAMPEGVVVADGQQVIGSVNQAVLTMLGYAEADLLGRPLSALFGGPAAAGALEDLRARGERTCVSRDGGRISVQFSATVVTAPDGTVSRIIGVLQDVRERRQLELELRHAQKLEAVGRLAAGIAHEINTPVQFVSDSVHFLREAMGTLLPLAEKHRATPGLSAEDGEELGYLVENVPLALDRSLEGLGRVATIVRSMKDFSRPDQRDATPVDLNQAIKTTLVIANNELKYVAEVTTQFGELPPVLCHASEINQALLNIIVNAAHAIEEVVKGTGQKGRIAVATRREQDDVVVAISDTGKGIPADIRSRIFEPFFTTRDVGRGTGQGLAIARAVIVEKHGGALGFETEVGKGTTFTLRLPISPKGSKATGTGGAGA